MLGALVGEYQTCYTSTSTSFCKRACFVDATLIDDMMYLFMCFSHVWTQDLCARCDVGYQQLWSVGVSPIQSILQLQFGLIKPQISQSGLWQNVKVNMKGRLQPNLLPQCIRISKWNGMFNYEKCSMGLYPSGKNPLVCEILLLL